MVYIDDSHCAPRKPSQGTGLRATFLGCNLFSLEIHWEVRV